MRTMSALRFTVNYQRARASFSSRLSFLSLCVCPFHAYIRDISHSRLVVSFSFFLFFLFFLFFFVLDVGISSGFILVKCHGGHVTCLMIVKCIVILGVPLKQPQIL
jgi:hypothetical protein